MNGLDKLKLAYDNSRKRWAGVDTPIPVLSENDVLDILVEYGQVMFAPCLWDNGDENYKLLNKFVDAGILITADKIKGHPENIMNGSYLYVLTERYPDSIFQ